GPEAPAIEAEVTRRGLQETVQLHGHLSHEAKDALVAGADLHLSASQGEGFGLSVLEAAAQGVPTVAYDVDGLRESIRDGITGWLAPEDALTDLTETALKELADPRRREEVAEACRAWAATFDWDASAHRVAELIAGAVTAQRGRRR
ncbi:MAG: glycosyltransferase, partial [Streptosporangiales bacterium]|nr:glycosyltransferase [Streptosporangiales bacterium]